MPERGDLARVQLFAAPLADEFLFPRFGAGRRLHRFPRARMTERGDLARVQHLAAFADEFFFPFLGAGRLFYRLPRPRVLMFGFRLAAGRRAEQKTPEREHPCQKAQCFFLEHFSLLKN